MNNKQRKRKQLQKVKKPKPILDTDIVVGEKVKDVKINERQHFLLFISMLIFFNALLIVSVYFVLYYIDRWYNWVICFGILALSAWLSFRTFQQTKVFHRCALYKNAIVINSIWFNRVVELKNIYELRVKISILDKIFKLNTNSLEVKIMNNKRKKFTIHFIEENAVRLKQKIIDLIDENAQAESNKFDVN